MDIASDPEFQQLQHLSAKVGSDMYLVQGAGGNTSIKCGEVMWIKASGLWLMHAQQPDQFVPVTLEPLRQALLDNDPRAEKSVAFVPEALNPSGLRPSIETTLHAIMPQRVVVHVHCVNTIAIAVQKNAEAQLTELLAGFHWLWAPYERPGLPLSKSIAESLTNHIDDVALGNHGLVVAADSVAEAETLLDRVRTALQQTPREPQTPNTDLLVKVAENTDYDLPELAEAHHVALDQVSLTHAAGGSLYPDHIIFLGDGSVISASDHSITETLEQHTTAGQPPPGSIIVPGAGVLMHKAANPGQQALAHCLSTVCARIPADAEINYLDSEQVYQLLNWEAEQYRQTL